MNIQADLHAPPAYQEYCVPANVILASPLPVYGYTFSLNSYGSSGTTIVMPKTNAASAQSESDIQIKTDMASLKANLLQVSQDFLNRKPLIIGPMVRGVLHDAASKPEVEEDFESWLHRITDETNI